MADEIDRANDLIAKSFEYALSQIRESNGKGLPGPKYCIECEDEIPVARQNLGFKLCVSCATDHERKKQLYSG